jgi:hypothetical protein
MIQDWKLKGELILNCNCEVFCPCVISLGKHPPTMGYCHGWAGIHIDEGRIGETVLDGLNVGILLDIPGKMTNGNWTAALYVDERAGAEALTGLTRIFSGGAGGSTKIFKLLISTFLGVKQAPITYAVEGKRRRFLIPGTIDGVIEPVPGKDPGQDLVIRNSEYWMGPDVVVCRGVKSKLRDFGRVWDLSGRSAEMVRIDWAGP